MLDIFAAKDKFGGRVNLLEAQAVADLQKGYGAAWERLNASWQPLADRVLAARKAGEQPRPGDLYRMERFQALMADAESAYKGLAAMGEGIARGTVEAAMDAAIDDYKGTLASLQRAGVVMPANDWDTSLNREAMLAGLGYTSKGSPLRSLFDKWGADASARTRKALVSGIVAGKGTDVIAKDIRRILGTTLWRSQLIARTEAHRAYREAGRQTAEQNPGAFDGWVWRAACDGATCAICWSKHGTVYPSNEKMQTHPGCRCALVPNPRSFASITGDESIPDVTAAFRTTGPDLFARLPASKQLKVLGPARFKMYRDQGFPLAAFVREGPRNRWGRAPRLIPLNRLPLAPSAIHFKPAASQVGLGAAAAGGYPDWVNNAAKRRRYDRFVANNPGVINVPRWAVKRGAPGQTSGPPVARPVVAPAVLPNGRPAQWVPQANVVGGRVWHPEVPPGGRPMTPGELARQQRRVDMVQQPLRWDPRLGRWAAPSSAARFAQRAAPPPGPAKLPTPVRVQPAKPPTPPNPWPAQPAKVVAHPDKPGRMVQLPPVPSGARPMDAKDIKRQFMRKERGQEDLVWKPANNPRIPGAGHWGRPAGAPATLTSHGARRLAVSRGLAPHGAGHGAAHGVPTPKPPTPKPVKPPTPAPKAPTGKMGGAPPPAWMQGPKRRRWLRWQAENPNAPPWQEPPKRRLAEKGRATTIAQARNVVKARAQREALFPRGRGAGAWGVTKHIPAAQPAPPVPPGARPMNAHELARQADRRARGLPDLVWKSKGAGGPHWGAPVVVAQPARARAYGAPSRPPKPPSVLQPLPAGYVKPTLKPITAAEARAKTGTAKGMPPEAQVKPNVLPGSQAYPEHPGAKHQMSTWDVHAVDKTSRSTGGVSESYFGEMRDPVTGKTMRVQFKPTAGQRRGLRPGVEDFTESEREYASYRVNAMLGYPLMHQTTIIRDIPDYTDSVTGRRMTGLGRAVVNEFLEPPSGWTHVRYGSFTDAPAAEQVAAAMHDSLILNVDRHGSNYFMWKNNATGESRIVAIDPSLSFPFVDGPNSYGTGAGSQEWTMRSQTLDPAAKARLEGFLRDEISIRNELEPLLGRTSVDGVFMRARWMWQHGRTLSSSELQSKVWWENP